MIYNLKSDELENSLQTLQNSTEYQFQNLSLLREALCHPSYASESKVPVSDNQRLEFLGDSVLEIIVSTYLFEKCPGEKEGFLTQLRSFLTDEPATASYARKLELGKLLLLGKSEIKADGRNSSSILGDAFEAFVAAVFLDGGMDAARKIILSQLPDLEKTKKKLEHEANPKGKLQELVQAHCLGTIQYETLFTAGTPHNPIYKTRVLVATRELGRGEGHSQKEAQKQAALQACLTLSQELDAKKVPVSETIVLDFDGVLCDSVDETCISAWKAAHSLWPERFPDETPSQECLCAFRKVRPFLETGYQAIPMLYMISEKLPAGEFQNNLNANIERIQELCHLSKQDLIDLFGKTRDNWTSTDLPGWLGAHNFYPGTLDALNSALQKKRYLLIATTKQERFVVQLLKSRGIDFPQKNIYGLERNLKKEALLEFLTLSPGGIIHFVEDRLQTLIRVESNQKLDAIRLHYAPWGYGTEKDLENASLDPRIHVENTEEFRNLVAGC